MFLVQNHGRSLVGCLQAAAPAMHHSEKSTEWCCTHCIIRQKTLDVHGHAQTSSVEANDTISNVAEQEHHDVLMGGKTTTPDMCW